jgi:hypothetical protein
LPVADWRIRDVLAVFVAGLFGSILIAGAVTAAGADVLEPLSFSFIFGGQAATSFLVVWFLSRRRGTGSLAADVGLIIRGKDWWGVPAGMALQIVIAIVTAPLIVLLFPDGPPEQAITEIAEQSQSLIDQLAVFAAVAVAAPIIEEIIFRGMLLSILARSLSKWLAIVISAAIFAGVHLLDPNAIAVVPGLFLLGVALAWAALKRGDLSLPIALHSGINLLAAITILYGDDILEWSEQQIEQLEGIIHFMSALG